MTAPAGTQSGTASRPARSRPFHRITARSISRASWARRTPRRAPPFAGCRTAFRGSRSECRSRGQKGWPRAASRPTVHRPDLDQPRAHLRADGQFACASIPDDLPGPCQRFGADIPADQRDHALFGGGAGSDGLGDDDLIRHLGLRLRLRHRPGRQLLRAVQRIDQHQNTRYRQSPGQHRVSNQCCGNGAGVGQPDSRRSTCPPDISAENPIKFSGRNSKQRVQCQESLDHHASPFKEPPTNVIPSDSLNGAERISLEGGMCRLCNLAFSIGRT